MNLVESANRTVYVQESTVKDVVQRTRTRWKSGTGKDAETEEVPNGWWVTFIDNPTAIKCDTKPNCKPGDKARCTWEFIAR